MDQAYENLVGALASLDKPTKYDKFTILRSTYAKVDRDTDIDTHLLVPKTLLGRTKKLQKCPLIVRIHGGYLVGGSSLYAPWFSDWVLEYAIQNEAVILSPNYRLLPEANAAELIQDVYDFWDWVMHGRADDLLRQENMSHLEIDLSKVLVLGESAGGYIAMQLALTFPTQIRALVAAYPMLDLELPFFTEAYSKTIVGVSDRSSEMVDNHVERFRCSSKPFPTEANPPDRLELSFAVIQHGRFFDFFGERHARLVPMKRLEDAEDVDGAKQGASLPFMFIFHGDNDTAVPREASENFVQELRSKRPKARIHYVTRPGDHGFDAECTLTTDWLEEGLALSSTAWLNHEANIWGYPALEHDHKPN